MSDAILANVWTLCSTWTVVQQHSTFSQIKLVSCPLSDLDHVEGRTNHTWEDVDTHIRHGIQMTGRKRKKCENSLGDIRANIVTTICDKERFPSFIFIRFLQLKLIFLYHFQFPFFLLSFSLSASTVKDIDGFCVVKFISIWWSKMILGPRKFYFFLIHFFMFLFIFLCCCFSFLLSLRIDLISSKLISFLPFFLALPTLTSSLRVYTLFASRRAREGGNSYSFVQFPHFHTINIDNESWLGATAKKKTGNKWAKKRDRRGIKNQQQRQLLMRKQMMDFI